MIHRTVLVTGASRGIGRAVADGLAADGHRVAYGVRNPSDLKDIQGLAVALDVTDDTSVQAALAQVEATLGPVEVLVNNAGISLSEAFTRTAVGDLERLLATNLTGSFRVAQAVVPGMQARRFGRLVFIASNAGLTGYSYTSAYCASKHAVVGLSRALAVELARHGITSNAICPGFVETDMAQASIDRIVQTTGRSEAEARQALEALSPQRRMIQVDEVLHAVRMLLPEGARGINGQALAVDGGQVLH
jgi:3-hydroxybutyrate dehydrogenase